MYDKKFVKVARQMCVMGATDLELANAMGVTKRSIMAWRNKYPAFARACKVAKKHPDERVKRSLFELAVGYEMEVEELFQHQGKIIRAKTIKKFKPDVWACLKWLFNRDPANWRDRSEVVTTTPDLANAMRDLAEKLPV